MSDVSNFKEITVEFGKGINTYYSIEFLELKEFIKQVKNSFTTDLYKHLYPQGS